MAIAGSAGIPGILAPPRHDGRLDLRPLIGYILHHEVGGLLRRVNTLGELHLTLRRDLLEHSFYRRWVVGDLSLDELRDYACQYAHVVAALPRWLRSAATDDPENGARLEQHAAEEDGHVALWNRFATALGVTPGELATSVPNAATARLLSLGDELSPQATGAAVAWALEAQAPAVSEEKLRGLKTHYQIGSHDGGDYFDVHRTRDLEHAEELDGVVAALHPHRQAEAQRTADAMIDGLWDLLTSVERAA
jgi:pyrroloquinoline-quinone synthase